MDTELRIKSDKKEFVINSNDSDLSKGTINSKNFNLDLIKEKEGSYHLIKDNKSYLIEVVSFDYNEKAVTLKVNNNIYPLTIKDRYDELLDRLGMSNMTSSKINNLKAPMPGLVLSVEVNGGSEVKKGDTLLVLEAMKMENVLKSPTDGIVKDISVQKGDTVEKNQLLLNFE